MSETAGMADMASIPVASTEQLSILIGIFKGSSTPIPLYHCRGKQHDDFPFQAISNLHISPRIHLAPKAVGGWTGWTGWIWCCC